MQISKRQTGISVMLMVLLLVVLASAGGRKEEIKAAGCDQTFQRCGQGFYGR